jgi:hypothetical protein
MRRMSGESLGAPQTPTILAVIALAVASGGVAVAAIPSADGTINGCYSNAKGTLRVIDVEAGKACGSGETAISWKSGTNSAGGDLTSNYPNPEIRPGAVGSPEIADEQVKTADLGPQSVTRNRLGPNAVSSAKVEDDTLTGSDVLDRSLRLSEVAAWTTSVGFGSHTFVPGECQVYFPRIEAVGGQPNDLALPLSENWPGTLNVSADVFDAADPPFGEVRVRVEICNISQFDTAVDGRTVRLIGLR